ncbi:hypothetical protein D3C76_1041260 [compost metagenome]
MLGLGRFGDHAHSASGDFRFLAHALGETGLIAGAGGDFGVYRGAARGHIDQVHTQAPQAPGQFDGFIRVPTIFHPVGCRNPHEQWQLRGPNLAHCLDHLQGQADAVFKAATVLIAALVAQG